MRLDRCKMPGRQRGAVAIVTGLFILFIALGSAVIVIDTGRLYMEQRSLQRMADSIALDTAHESALCGAGELNDEAQRQQIAAANGVTSDDELEVLLGRLENVDGRWEFTEDDDPETAEAVHVELSRTVPASLVMGGLFGNDITLSKQATSRRIPQASIRVGSSLIDVDSQESEILNAVFGELLDSEVSLSAASYEGIADATVSLQDMVNADASAGTVNELLTSNITLGEALELFANAASEAGVATAGMEGLLEAGGGIEDAELTLADILRVESPTSEAGLEAEVGMLDMISAAALLANEENALTVPLGVDLAVPGLTNVEATLELFIVEAPQLAVGPPGRDSEGNWRTEAETAQVRASLQAVVEADLLSVVGARAELATTLDAAGGRAWFESIQCLPYSRQEFENAVLGTESELASLGLDPDNSGLEVWALGGLATINADLSIDDEDNAIGVASTSSVIFCDNQPCHVDELPQSDSTSADLATTLGNGLVDLTDNMEVEVSITLLGLGFGVSAGEIEDAILEELLIPLLTGMDELLMPVLEALGISIGNTDVTLVDADLERVELVQ